MNPILNATVVVLKIAAISFEDKTVSFEIHKIFSSKKFYKMPELGDILRLKESMNNFEGVICDMEFAKSDIDDDTPLIAAVPIRDRVADIAHCRFDKTVIFCIGRTFDKWKHVGVFPSHKTGEIEFVTVKNNDYSSFVVG